MGLLERVGMGIATGGLSELAQENPFGSETLGDLTDPGRGDRDKAIQEYQENQARWLQTLPKDEDGNPIIPEMPGYDDLSFSDEEVEALKYEEGPDLYLGDRHLVGEDSGFARGNAGITTAEQGMDYMRDVLEGEGFDAITAAHMAQERDRAEAARQSQVAAVQRDAELRGVGGGGAEMLGALTAGQGAVGDQYRYGLEAAALGQANMAGASEALRQGGHARQQIDDQDQWSRMADRLSRQQYDADRQWDVSETNWGRKNDVRDANTDWERNAAGHGFTAEQTAWGNTTTALDGAGAGGADAAAQHNINAGERFDPFGTALDFGTSYTKKRLGAE